MIRSSVVVVAVAAAAWAFAIPAAADSPAPVPSSNACPMIAEQLPDLPESGDLQSCLDRASNAYDSAVDDAASVNEYGVGNCNDIIDGSAEPQELRECLSGVRQIYDNALSAAQRELDQRTEECVDAYEP